MISLNFVTMNICISVVCSDTFKKLNNNKRSYLHNTSKYHQSPLQGQTNRTFIRSGISKGWHFGCECECVNDKKLMSQFRNL